MGVRVSPGRSRGGIGGLGHWLGCRGGVCGPGRGKSPSGWAFFQGSMSEHSRQQVGPSTESWGRWLILRPGGPRLSTALAALEGLHPQPSCSDFLSDFSGSGGHWVTPSGSKSSLWPGTEVPLALDTLGSSRTLQPSLTRNPAQGWGGLGWWGVEPYRAGGISTCWGCWRLRSSDVAIWVLSAGCHTCHHHAVHESTCFPPNPGLPSGQILGTLALHRPL